MFVQQTYNTERQTLGLSKMVNRLSGTAEYNHSVGFNYAFNHTDLFYALVNFSHIHATNNCDDIVFTADFVGRFNIRDDLNLSGNVLRRICWVGGKQGYGLRTFCKADFNSEFAYYAIVG